MAYVAKIVAFIFTRLASYVVAIYIHFYKYVRSYYVFSYMYICNTIFAGYLSITGITEQLQFSRCHTDVMHPPIAT